MSACAFCGIELADAPSRACGSCGDRLHDACWDQIAARKIAGCGHPNGITTCAYPREDLVVTLDSYGSLRAWDLASRKDRELHKLTGGGSHLLLTLDGKRLLAMQYNEIVVFRVEDLTIEKTITVSDGLPYVSVSADGSRLLTSNNTSLRLVDLTTGRISEVGAPVAQTIEKLAISPDGTRVAAMWSQTQFTLRDADTGEAMCERDLSGHARYFDKFEFTPTGQEILLDGDNTLFALDGLTGQLRWKEALNNYVLRWRPNKDGSLTCAAGGSYGDFQVWRFHRKSNPMHSAPSIFRGLCLSPNKAAFLDDHRVAAVTGDGLVLVVDTQTSTTLLMDGHRNTSWNATDAEARRLWSRQNDVYSPENGYVLDGEFVHPGPTTNAYGVRHFSVDTGAIARERRMGEQPSAVRSFVYEGVRRDLNVLSNAMAVGDEDADVRWRTDGLKYTDAGSVVALRDGDGRGLVLASATWSMLVQALDLESGALRFTIEKSDTYPVSGNNLIRRRDGVVLLLVRRNNSSTPMVDCLRVTPSGETSVEGTLQCSLNWGSEFVVPTPDGVHAVMSSIYAPGSSSPSIGLWNLETFEFVNVASGEHRNGIRNFAVSPVGHLLASSSANRLLRVYDLRSARPVLAIGGFPRNISRVMFSADGSVLLAFSEDTLAMAYDLAGIDARTDTYSALCRARSGRDEDVKAAAAHVAAIKRASTSETVAGALLFASQYGADEWLAGAIAAVDRGILATLAEDLDRRVRDEAAKRAGG